MQTRHRELNYSVTSRQALSVSVIRATSPLLIDGRVLVHRAVMGDESRLFTTLINHTSCFESCYWPIRIEDLSFSIFDLWFYGNKNRSRSEIVGIEYNKN